MNELLPKENTENNIFVYLDVKIGDEKAGRIIIELFKDIVPKTVENFRGLCTGEYGVGKNGKKLHFKGTEFHKVMSYFMIQGGDIFGDGSMDSSIYGKPFEDENFILLHDIEGTVGMANNGPNTNVSQFYITTAPCHHLDGTNVAFGYVRKGLNIIKEMGEVPKDEEHQPLMRCLIQDCGELKPGEDFNINERDETGDVFPPWPDDYEQFDNCNVEEVVTAIKNSGNYFYNRKNFIDSERKYKKVLRYIEWINKKKLKHNCKTINEIKVQTLLNLAAVKLNKQKYRDVVDICTQVLDMEGSHVKALYRRGQARLKLKDYDKALIDLQQASQLIPNDSKIQKDYLAAKKFRQNYLEEERKLCTKMFQ